MKAASVKSIEWVFIIFKGLIRIIQFFGQRGNLPCLLQYTHKLIQLISSNKENH